MKATSMGAVLGLGFAMAAAPALQAGALRQQGPHVHGISHLDVALEGSTLDISLAAPGHNIVGFEHPPYTPSQRQRLDSAVSTLKSPTGWLIPERAAGCTLLEASVVPHGYAAGDEPASEGNDHTDIDAHYRYHCQKSANLGYIDVSLADRFDETREVVVDLVARGRQDEQVLEAGQHRALLAP